MNGTFSFTLADTDIEESYRQELFAKRHVIFLMPYSIIGQNNVVAIRIDGEFQDNDGIIKFEGEKYKIIDGIHVGHHANEEIAVFRSRLSRMTDISVQVVPDIVEHPSE